MRPHDVLKSDHMVIGLGDSRLGTRGSSSLRVRANYLSKIASKTISAARRAAIGRWLEHMARPLPDAIPAGPSRPAERKTPSPTSGFGRRGASIAIDAQKSSRICRSFGYVPYRVAVKREGEAGVSTL